MKTGFSLIELVVVIALISILSANLGPKVLTAIDRVKVSETLNNLDDLRLALRIFQVENGKGVESGVDFDNVFGGEDGEVPETPSTNGILASNKMYLGRTNKGGWIYDEDTEEIYANLPNGAYTGKNTEIWESESIDGTVAGETLKYEFDEIGSGGNIEDLAGVYGYGDWTIGDDGEIYALEDKKWPAVRLKNEEYEDYEFSLNVKNSEGVFHIFVDHVDDLFDTSGSQMIVVDTTNKAIEFSEHSDDGKKVGEIKIDLSDTGIFDNENLEYKISVSTGVDGSRTSKLSIGDQEVYTWLSEANGINGRDVQIAPGQNSNNIFSNMILTKLN